MLSGSGGDGAIGIKRINKNGGLTVAQEPGEAEHDGMPRSAIATGMVDWVLPVAEMPNRLLEYQRIQGRVRLPEENLPGLPGIEESDDENGTMRNRFNVEVQADPRLREKLRPVIF